MRAWVKWLLPFGVLAMIARKQAMKTSLVLSDGELRRVYIVDKEWWLVSTDAETVNLYGVARSTVHTLKK